MAEDGAEATLELTILSAEGLKDSTFLSSSRPFVVAWVDPTMKRSTKVPHALPRSSSSSTPQKLHIPLSSRSLWDPTSFLTIQILSPSLPFQSGKPIGTATLRISSATFSGEPLTLPLRTTSGRAHGFLRVSVRVLWCLDAPPVAVDSVAGVSIGVDGPDFIPTAPPMPEDLGADGPDFIQTAPPMPEDLSYLSEFQEETKETSLQSFFPSAPIDELDATMSDLGRADVSEEVHVPDLALNADRTRLRVIPDGTNAWRSFLVGLVSGTVAAVLVGVAGLSEG